MTLRALLMVRAVTLLEETRMVMREDVEVLGPPEPAAPSSTCTMPMLYPTLGDLGLGPTPEEMEREMQLPGPMNRKQKREAARNARRSVVRRMTL